MRVRAGAGENPRVGAYSLLSSAIALSAVSAHILKVLLVLGRVEGEGEGGGEQGEGGGDEHQLRRQRQGLRGARAPLDLAAGGRQERVRLQALQEVSSEWSSETVISWSTAPRSPQRTNVLYREPNSRHSKTSARAPDGLGQGVSGQPVLPATPPDHQIDRQRCDRASFQAGSPRSQPPLTVRISPHARSHVAWRITHYDQCVSYTRRVA